MTICPTCGEEYDRLGSHFRWNEDHIPHISGYEWEILRGVMMSDGWVGSSGRCVQGEWACKEYVDYISRELGWICGDPTLRGGDRDAWSVNTISHDDIEEFSQWYESGKKVWDISEPLTDTAFQHLYAGDGSLSNRKNRSPILIIACSNESSRLEQVASWFAESGYGLPSCGYSDGSERLRFSTDATREILKSIEPVPGYEYKWGPYK